MVLVRFATYRKWTAFSRTSGTDGGLSGFKILPSDWLHIGALERVNDHEVSIHISSAYVLTGFARTATNYFLTKDHLGGIREMTDN
jgi:hypothetical protein